MRVLITGGAGFVGSNLALSLIESDPGGEVVAFDNLYRRGSELNVPRLQERGVSFIEGDVRNREDLNGVGSFDALIECSAEPSVMAGVDGDTDYLVGTNLVGAYESIELARRNDAQLVFLSTSRVYPVEQLLSVNLEEAETRFELAADQEYPGVSPSGISEDFPLEGPRTLYGATKLAAEHLITEYVESFDLKAVVNRCGVIAGPWQMGKVDQGVFTYWMLAHYFGWPLEYIGFGGTGKQVRDLMHIEDLAELVLAQLREPDLWSGRTLNVGGGRKVSLSLQETTHLCAELTDNRLPITAASDDRPGDVPVYISDCARLADISGWAPQRDPETIMLDIRDWIEANEAEVLAALGPGSD